MDHEIEYGRSLRPRGTRILYDFDGQSASGSEGESSAAGAQSSDEEGGDGNRRGRRIRSRQLIDEADDDDSEDEWRPESGKKRGDGRGKRRVSAAADETDSEEDGPPDGDDDSNDGDGEAARPRSNKRRPSKSSSTSLGGVKKKKRAALVQQGDSLSAGAAAAQRHKAQKKAVSQRGPAHGNGNQRIPSTIVDSDRPNTSADRTRTSPVDDGIDARAEADRLWKDVRSRKRRDDATAQPKAAGTNGAVNKPPGGLDNWLGVEPPSWPTTCSDAMINDRDSLFVGFVYALSSSSQSEITRCLSHLTKVVQPQAIPTARLPPGMQHLAPTRRGATHDMFAWRCLALKRGRTGLGGPEDFGLEEGQEDDGERFGAKEIAKVIRMYGATDVLVVVSRWYGGTMLGPVRFKHIEESAKAALGQHMVNEAMADLLTELRRLDAEIADTRAQRSEGTSLQPSSSSSKPAPTYVDLDPERAQRLVGARKKQLELLRKASIVNTSAREVPQAAEPVTANVDNDNVEESAALTNDLDEAEEMAALEALAAAEAAAEASRHAAQSTPLPDPQLDDIRVKAEPSGPEEERSPPPFIKPDPDAPREPSPAPIMASNETSTSTALPFIKTEPLDHEQPELALPNAPPPLPRVKLEQPDDDTDITGWDELS